MDERRRFQRKYLMYYSRVFNQHTGEVLGHLVDITPGGAQLLSERPLEVGVVYNLRMELPDELGAKQFLNFEARAIWSSQDIIPAFFDSGLEIKNITPDDADIIQQLVDTFGFKEH